MSQIEVIVYLTPLLNLTEYDTEVDISDAIIADSISEIREYIDSEDFDFGLFSFGSITLTVDNANGRFNEAEDPRSMFTTKRDFSKVRVVLRDSVITRDSAGTPTTAVITDTTVFKGLLRDDGSRLDGLGDAITFEVLSYDSVLSSAKLATSQVAAGDTAETVFETLLDQDIITNLLTVSDANITPALDFTIDDATFFDNLNGRDILKAMLPATNSILLINEDDEIVIRDREEDLVLDVLNLYGKFVLDGQENIIDLFDYNTGNHRMFNSIRVNGSEANDAGSIGEFGLRQKEFSFDFTTNSTTAITIAQTMADEFKVPKIEVSVVVPIDIGKDTRLLQQVSVDYPLKAVPFNGLFLPVFGDSDWDDSGIGMPYEYGSLEIPASMAFKIIERRHDLAAQTTTLKLRQTGTEWGEGFYS